MWDSSSLSLFSSSCASSFLCVCVLSPFLSFLSFLLLFFCLLCSSFFGLLSVARSLLLLLFLILITSLGCGQGQIGVAGRRVWLGSLGFWDENPLATGFRQRKSLQIPTSNSNQHKNLIEIKANFCMRPAQGLPLCQIEFALFMYNWANFNSVAT